MVVGIITDRGAVRIACDLFSSAANEKVSVRKRWKEQQARDSRGALEKLSFIDQRLRDDTNIRGRERENVTD